METFDLSSLEGALARASWIRFAVLAPIAAMAGFVGIYGLWFPVSFESRVLSAMFLAGSAVALVVTGLCVAILGVTVYRRGCQASRIVLEAPVVTVVWSSGRILQLKLNRLDGDLTLVRSQYDTAPGGSSFSLRIQGSSPISLTGPAYEALVQAAKSHQERLQITEFRSILGVNRLVVRSKTPP